MGIEHVDRADVDRAQVDRAQVDRALVRLRLALERLEAGLALRGDAEHARSDLQAELDAAHDDRARLAEECDGVRAFARDARETAVEVDRRLERVMADLNQALSLAGPSLAAPSHAKPSIAGPSLVISPHAVSPVDTVR